jgi:hypothetical protein
MGKSVLTQIEVTANMFKIYYRAEELPKLWDELAGDNIFLKRAVLNSLEALNPCSQSYHMNEDFSLAFVRYKIELDLFTFSKSLKLRVPMNIIGIALSVSKSGFTVDAHKLEELSSYIKSFKGLQVVLNSTAALKLPTGRTLPVCLLQIKWQSFQQYIDSMRSNYRHRVHKALKKFSNVEIEKLEDNSSFDKDMYKLYEEVYENSKEKLEKLSIEFFRKFPAVIFKFTADSRTLGFVQLIENGEEIIFLLGGFDHSLNTSYDSYMNMLLFIIEYGIKNNFKYIDLGQTAEETKLKLGAVQQGRNMHVFHSNPIYNFFINSLISKFSYKEYKINNRVFR